MSGDGFLSGYLLDRKGGYAPVGPEEIERWKPEDGLLWVHLDEAAEESRRWLAEESGLPELACEALLREDARPRTLVSGEAVLAVLRGVNQTPGEEPEDMVALRLWVDEDRVIDLRHRKLRFVSDVRDELARGRGPTSAGELLLDLADTMMNRMEPVVDHLEDEIAELESRMKESLDSSIRERLGSIRRRTIRLRRYVAPQRDALRRLRVSRLCWLDELAGARLDEVIERINHVMDDLDCIREHAGVAQDELASLQSEHANVNMYRLSVIAAVLLPPSLIAGLLGANVTGIPLSDNPQAFLIVCGLIVIVSVIEVWILRWRRWI